MISKRLGLAALLALPILTGTVFARSNGPIVRRTGAPIDGGQDCSACHRTFSPANSDARGFVRISAVNYTPGQRQTLRVQVFHPDAARWGFQLTARLASDENAKAGVLSPSAPNIQVVCDPQGSAPCGTDREFAEHAEPGTRIGANGLATWNIEWLPPAAGSGEVVFYVAGNAANGDGTNAGDRIYTSSLRISQAPAQVTPAVTNESAIVAAGFGGGRNISPGTWMEIYGTGLSNVTREWAGFDFTGANAPRALEGVSVTVGGRDAFVRFISPTQVNVQVPDGIGSGPLQVIVRNSAGSSAPIPMTGTARSPQVLAPSNFRVNGRQLVAALFPDNTTFVARAGELGAGITSRPARSGETVIVYAIGAGAVTPAVAPGVVASGTTAVTNPVVRIGDAPATLSYAGLSPGFVGLYQFNIVVPNVSAGDQRLSLSVDGVSSGQETFLVVGQ
jgi:uncharacterized protein (TIGR03437 family)